MKAHTGSERARLGELEALRVGDLDETLYRWRLSQAVTKTRRARWVPVPRELFRAVVKHASDSGPTPDGVIFGPIGAGLRTDIARICRRCGVTSFSPQGLRHRRATLWHLAGVPPVEAAAWLGHSPVEHLRTYAHAMIGDRRELDYKGLLSPRPPGM
jgi:integrase